MATTDKKRQAKTLLSLISNESTGAARDLLKKYSGQDAKNYNDLEYKLAKFYQNSPDKIQLEKELAQIHPHKDFILKYLGPQTSTPTETSLSADGNPANIVVQTKKQNCGDSDPDCNCNNQTEKMSGADGSGFNYNGGHRNDSIIVVGIIAIVALVSVTLAYKNK